MRAAVLAACLLAAGADALACGTERWTEKVLADAAAARLSLVPRTITVAGMNALPKACAQHASERSGIELQLYRLTARVKLMKYEADGDLHIVLEDQGQTVVVESPSTACIAHSHFRAVLKAARVACERLRVGQTVTVQGPVFYDFFHQQTGMSKSCAELHPVMFVR